MGGNNLSQNMMISQQLMGGMTPAVRKEYKDIREKEGKLRDSLEREVLD